MSSRSFAAGGGGTTLVVRRARLTAGDITAPNTAGGWQLLTGTTISVPAAVGDYVELGAGVMTQPGASLFLDLVVAVSGAIARAASTGTTTPGAEGLPGLYPSPSTFRTSLAPFGFVAEAADLAAGAVTFQLAVKAAGTGTIYRSATYPLILVARNFGPVDYA